MVFQFAQMIEEIQKCQNAGATIACVMQVYVYIDTLAYLGMPISQTKNTRKDFIDWVEKYLKADSIQSYCYRGVDVYGARCALLHQFSAGADYHQVTPNVIKFGYSDGGKHYYDASINATFVIIGVASLVHDFMTAVEAFMRDIQIRIRDTKEQVVLQTRLNQIFGTFPFPA